MYCEGYLVNSVVDPDPNWIRIQQLCGSGFVFRKRTVPIRIDPDQHKIQKEEIDLFEKFGIFLLSKKSLLLNFFQFT